MWQVIVNWPWGSIWAAISAIFTAAAVGVAGWAMMRWRKQDELRVKLNFKLAVADYAKCLGRMPETLVGPARIDHSKNIDELNNLFHACDIAWTVMEGLLDSKKNVTKRWTKIAEKHEGYVTGGKIKKKHLYKRCLAILALKFVFK